MSQLREFAGKSWHEWPSSADPEDVSLASSPSHSDLASGDITPSSSRASSPPPHSFPKDDVTKLLRNDMHIFGQCPVQDEFLMAVCDSCGIVVKLEAFASHVKLRHGLPLKFATMASSSSSSSSSRSGRVKPIKPGIVDLQKLSSKLKTDRIGSKKSSSTSSTGSSCPPPSRSKTPTPDKELSVVMTSKSPSVAATSTANISLHDEVSLMDVDDNVSSSSGIVNNSDSVELKSSLDSTPFLSKFGDDDVDSNNTSNVISIPDTDPLPHNMSRDLMAMVSEVTRPMEVDEHPQSSPLIKLQVHQDDSSAPTTLVLAPTMNTSSGATFSSRPQVPAAIVVQSPTSGIKSMLPNQPSLIKQSPGKKGIGGNRCDRKPMREYHPDKHCGVWDQEASRHCTRALTCKSHSVLLKRKVDGRCKPFDELLIAHKKAQAALAAATVAGTSPPISSTVTTVNVTPAVVTLPTTPVAPSSIIHAVQLNGGIRPGPISLSKPPPPHLLFPQTPIQQPVPLQSQQLLQQQQQPFHFPTKDPEDSFHYTTDHPKPLSVCTFGGRRIGGLMFSDRSKLLTRKLVRVAITTAVPGMGGTRTSGVAGFHRIGPRVTLFQGDSPTPLAIVNGLKRGKEQPTFLLNYSLGGKRTVVGATTLGLTPATPTVNLSSFQAGSSVVIPESFKTDIQDFKGGIKFELGNKIKHIHLPSGGDIP